MHYKTDAHNENYKNLKTIDDFISEIGVTPERVSDFTLKAHKDLPAELTYLVFDK